jgi:multiple sugar transport system substrate-binding protein
MSYILNSISAWRTAQGDNPSVADDISVDLKIRRRRSSATPVMDRPEVLHALMLRKFLLHYTANLPSVTFNSKLYDFRRLPTRIELGGWLARIRSRQSPR